MELTLWNAVSKTIVQIVLDFRWFKYTLEYVLVFALL